MGSELVDLPARFGMDRGTFDRLAERPPGEPRLATSVILVRDAPAGGSIEVFLLERAPEMAFAAGASVFPGGGLDATDHSARADGLVDDATAEDAGRRWGCSPDVAAALLSAAVRETFEETGVLLGGQVAPDPEVRARLTAHESSLAAELVAAGSAPRFEHLVPWARWITPEGLPRRYDTYFFVAMIPAGQEPDGATSEAVAAGWCAPAQALRESEEGRRGLLPPTWAVLGELAAFTGTATELLAATTGRRLEPVTPAFRPGADRVGLVVPAQALGVVR